MKKLLSMVVIGSALLLTACGDKDETGKDTKTINMAFGVSTYTDQFRDSIKPMLEKQGYTVNMRIFSNNMQVNPAVKEGALDATVHQSIAYMQGINKALDMDMIDIAFVPSAPQGIYSTKHSSLNEVKDGTTVAVPNDPVNQERAIRILEQLGWVKVKADAGTVDFNLNSVEPGKYKIDIKSLEPAQGLAALADVDYAVINGNFIANAGKKITDALLIEDTPKQHRIIVSIQSKDKDADWVKAIQAAYASPEFENYIRSNSKYDGFILPDAWNNR